MKDELRHRLRTTWAGLNLAERAIVLLLHPETAQVMDELDYDEGGRPLGTPRVVGTETRGGPTC